MSNVRTSAHEQQMSAYGRTVRDRFESMSFREVNRSHEIARYAYMAVPLIDRSLLEDPRETRGAIKAYKIAMTHAAQGRPTSGDREAITRMINDEFQDDYHENKLPKKYYWLSPEQSEQLTEMEYVLAILKHMNPRFEEFIILNAALADDIFDIAQTINHRSNEERRILSPLEFFSRHRDLKEYSFWDRVKLALRANKHSRLASQLHNILSVQSDRDLIGQAMYLNKLDEEFQRAFKNELESVLSSRRKVLLALQKGTLYRALAETKLSEDEDIRGIYDEIITLDGLNSDN